MGKDIKTGRRRIEVKERVQREGKGSRVKRYKRGNLSNPAVNFSRGYLLQVTQGRDEKVGEESNILLEGTKVTYAILKPTFLSSFIHSQHHSNIYPFYLPFQHNHIHQHSISNASYRIFHYFVSYFHYFVSNFSLFRIAFFLFITSILLYTFSIVSFLFTLSLHFFLLSPVASFATNLLHRLFHLVTFFKLFLPSLSFYVPLQPIFIFHFFSHHVIYISSSYVPAYCHLQIIFMFDFTVSNFSKLLPRPLFFFSVFFSSLFHRMHFHFILCPIIYFFTFCLPPLFRDIIFLYTPLPSTVSSYIS